MNICAFFFDGVVGIAALRMMYKENKVGRGKIIKKGMTREKNNANVNIADLGSDSEARQCWNALRSYNL